MAINTTEKTKILSDMEEKWKRVEAVWGGTDAVREEGETYLYRIHLKLSTRTDCVEPHLTALLS